LNIHTQTRPAGPAFYYLAHLYGITRDTLIT
jgi:hypothetical protein